MRNLHLEKCRGIEIVLAYALLECYNSGKAYFLLRKFSHIKGVTLSKTFHNVIQESRAFYFNL